MRRRLGSVVDLHTDYKSRRKKKTLLGCLLLTMCPTSQTGLQLHAAFVQIGAGGAAAKLPQSMTREIYLLPFSFLFSSLCAVFHNKMPHYARLHVVFLCGCQGSVCLPIPPRPPRHPPFTLGGRTHHDSVLQNEIIN